MFFSYTMKGSLVDILDPLAVTPRQSSIYGYFRPALYWKKFHYLPFQILYRFNCLPLKLWKEEFCWTENYFVLFMWIDIFLPATSMCESVYFYSFFLRQAFENWLIKIVFKNEMNSLTAMEVWIMLNAGITGKK